LFEFSNTIELKTILAHEVNENTTLTRELDAADHDYVSLQRRHARRVSRLPDLLGARTERDACTARDAAPIDEGHVSDTPHWHMRALTGALQPKQRIVNRKLT